MKQYTYDTVANWFLAQNSMTPKKLEKLVYYAEAWANALYGKSLINNTQFEAWAHGPVSPDLYHEYKFYGWNLIPKKEDDHAIKDEEAKYLLESVWVTYGDKSANELEALTHTEAPWINARHGLDDGAASNEPISKEDMRNYYLSIYNGD